MNEPKPFDADAEFRAAARFRGTALSVAQVTAAIDAERAARRSAPMLNVTTPSDQDAKESYLNTPAPSRRRRNDDALPMRHEYRSPGKVQVFCFILGAWRVVYTDDDRSKAEAWAHENIRREDGTVSAIELRERGNDSALDYGCTDVSARSRVSAVMRRLRSRLERQQESQKKLQALLHRLTKPG